MGIATRLTTLETSDLGWQPSSARGSREALGSLFLPLYGLGYGKEQMREEFNLDCTYRKL